MSTLIDLSILAIFIPTFFFVSITPGMCMTLAMTMGMTSGLKRTFWMMGGELIGVGLIALLSVIGVATIMLQYPTVFVLFKYIGGGYLFWLGVLLWLSRGKMAITEECLDAPLATRMQLATQGFVTAVANPKGWAFFIALLPPFINEALPIVPQIAILLAIILTIEFCCLVLYASGGRTMSKFLQKSGNVKLMNRIAATLMMGVGVWLAFG